MLSLTTWDVGIVACVSNYLGGPRVLSVNVATASSFYVNRTAPIDYHFVPVPLNEKISGFVIVCAPFIYWIKLNGVALNNSYEYTHYTLIKYVGV